MANIKKINGKPVGSPQNHANLTNKEWSNAGHIIDTDVDFDGNGATGLRAPVDDQDASTKKFTLDSRNYVNVERYGALGDFQYIANDNATISTDTLNVDTDIFTSGDVGKIIIVSGAGTSGRGHKTTIASFSTAKQITITDSVITAVTDADVFFCTDDTQAWNDAFDASESSGLPVYAPAKIYGVTGLNPGYDHVTILSDQIPTVMNFDLHHMEVFGRGYILQREEQANTARFDRKLQGCVLMYIGEDGYDYSTSSYREDNYVLKISPKAQDAPTGTDPFFWRQNLNSPRLENITVCCGVQRPGAINGKTPRNSSPNANYGIIVAGCANRNFKNVNIIGGALISALYDTNVPLDEEHEQLSAWNGGGRIDNLTIDQYNAPGYSWILGYNIEEDYTVSLTSSHYDDWIGGSFVTHRWASDPNTFQCTGLFVDWGMPNSEDDPPCAIDMRFCDNNNFRYGFINYFGGGYHDKKYSVQVGGDFVNNNIYEDIVCGQVIHRGPASTYTVETIKEHIKAFSDAGGGYVTVELWNAHNYSNGVEGTLTGSTNYNGTYTVSNVTTYTFDILATWAGDDGDGYFKQTEYQRNFKDHTGKGISNTYRNIEMLDGSDIPEVEDGAVQAIWINREYQEQSVIKTRGCIKLRGGSVQSKIVNIAGRWTGNFYIGYTDFFGSSYNWRGRGLVVLKNSDYQNDTLKLTAGTGIEIVDTTDHNCSGSYTVYNAAVADQQTWDDIYGQGFHLSESFVPETGTHDGGASSILIDSSATWTTNQFVDYKIYNSTTGAYGTVTGNTGTTITATMTAGLDGSTAWADGDTYELDKIGLHAQTWTVRPKFDLNLAQTGVLTLEPWMVTTGVDDVTIVGPTETENAVHATLTIQQNAAGDGVWPGWDSTTESAIVWVNGTNLYHTISSLQADEQIILHIVAINATFFMSYEVAHRTGIGKLNELDIPSLVDPGGARFGIYNQNNAYLNDFPVGDPCTLGNVTNQVSLSSDNNAGLSNVSLTNTLASFMLSSDVVTNFSMSSLTLNSTYIQHDSSATVTLSDTGTSFVGQYAWMPDTKWHANGNVFGGLVQDNGITTDKVKYGHAVTPLSGGSLGNYSYYAWGSGWTELFSVNASNGDVKSSGQFIGAGTGLTGTAASLSIGGNAATATNATKLNVGAVTGSTWYNAVLSSFNSTGSQSLYRANGQNILYSNDDQLLSVPYIIGSSKSIANKKDCDFLVEGNGAVTSGNLAKFDDTTGELIGDSNLDPADIVTSGSSPTFDNLTLTGNFYGDGTGTGSRGLKLTDGWQNSQGSWMNASRTLHAEDTGWWLWYWGGSGNTLSLPDLSSANAGWHLWLTNYSSSGVTVAVTGATDEIRVSGQAPGSGTSSITLATGDTIHIIYTEPGGGVPTFFVK